MDVEPKAGNSSNGDAEIDNIVNDGQEESYQTKFKKAKEQEAVENAARVAKFTELMKKKVTLVYGVDSKKVTVTQDILARSQVFGDLIPEEDENGTPGEIEIGGEEVPSDHLNVIIQYFTLLHAKGFFKDPPSMEDWNPRGPNAALDFEIPDDALALFSNMLIDNTFVPGTKRLDFDRLVAIVNLSEFLKMDSVREAIAQVIAIDLRDKTPEDVQKMFGKEEFTKEDEEAVFAQYPFLRS